ncbi:MAG: hypothetical protein WB766_19970, partial [Roseiarcus sp.]
RAPPAVCELHRRSQGAKSAGVRRRLRLELKNAAIQAGFPKGPQKSRPAIASASRALAVIAPA